MFSRLISLSDYYGKSPSTATAYASTSSPTDVLSLDVVRLLFDLPFRLRRR